MTDDMNQKRGPVRWRYLLLAALIVVAMAAIMAGLWQLPRVFPLLAATTATDAPSTRTVLARPTSSPTPSIVHPTIHKVTAEADDQAGAITFHLEAEAPPDRRVNEVVLWYDTEAGRQLQRTSGSLPASISFDHRLDVTLEGLTTTLTSGELDYWWLVRDSAGESVRRGGTVTLGPGLQAQIATPTPEVPPLDFTWMVSESRHFEFYYVPDSAAERDRFQLGPLAEAALERITSVLETEYDGQMRIYLVPRVFWQGGATYGEQVQLVSYLDRNYTDVEIWSYFTHEGTHALAQTLLQPKDQGGGPDGVLVEGLAVWASDGHYRQEPIDAWAAVVADSDDYIPLEELRTGSFYDFQHEISYLEGASFVKFLIERDGLDTLKELYGLATKDELHDEALVERLYGTSYASLEEDWLAYLAGVQPTPQQAEAWHLKVRFFDLMRRYETELDPDARILPDTSPTEWTTDTLQIFLRRLGASVNIVLETALIAAQERMSAGDWSGAASVLYDVEAALDADGALDRPSLQARLAVLGLLSQQDRAVRRGDVPAYRGTLEAGGELDSDVEAFLARPFTTYRQEVVRLDVADDGLGAHGVVLVHAQVWDGDYAEDGRLFEVEFVRDGGGWLMSTRRPFEPVLPLPPAP
jgi:hypothetical protein